MSEFVVNDFSSGLISSDDDVNGRKNGLLRMENVELDQNGAIVLTGGTVKLDVAFPRDISSMFSKFLGTGTPESPQYRYACDTLGNIYRNGAPIAASGSTGSMGRTAYLGYFDYVLICSHTKRMRDDGATPVDLGQGTATAITALALNGAGVLNGDYEYIQINVFVNASGAYRARSKASPIAPITATDNKISVTPSAPGGVQNEVWIFRRGGTVDQFYRIKQITSSYTTPFDDNTSDQDSINNGVTANTLSRPIDSTNLTDDILEMVGPINQRILFFTKNAVHFSEINSPESYVPSQSIFFMGAPQTAEVFLWAKKIDVGVVAIGTSKDVYRLTGSLIEQSDGTLDVDIKGMSVDAPPISIDVDIYNKQLIYMCAYGWILCDQFGTTTPICPPNVDVNYYGKSRYGVLGVPIYVASPDYIYRYSVAVIRNKAFFSVPIGTSYPAPRRLDVYDFIRKYWRSIVYPASDGPLMLKSQEDHTVIGYFTGNKYIKRLDDQFTFTLDNSPAVNQTMTILTPFYDCQMPRNRKDGNTLKFKVDTGNVACALGIYLNGIHTFGPDAGGTSLGNITANGMTEISIDLNTYLAAPANIFKSFQLSLSGALAVFRLSDVSLNYDARPEQRTFYRIPQTNFGAASKKRVRTWPFSLDTLGNNIIFTPTVDGVTGATSTFNNSGSLKSTFLHFFKTDVFGIDYGGIFSGGLFEFYEALSPEVVQVLPVAKQYDQVGPEELARYGKLKEFEIRILPFGTVIPYILYFQDGNTWNGNIAVVNGVEDVYPIQIPKTAAGEIIRIEFGPTAFNFHRFYIRGKVIKSGKDTDVEWITLSTINPNGNGQ